MFVNLAAQNSYAGSTIFNTSFSRVVTTHVYDNVRGVLTGLQSTSGGATIQNWSYDFDAVGNMTFRKNTVAGYAENFAYDKLNRLTIVRSGTVQCYHGRFNSNMCYSGALQSSYAYDAIGNITYKSDVGHYAYDPNHPHAVSSAGGNTYSYDANGNQINGAGRTLQWTSFNKPSGIWTATAYTGFAYDANHNRVVKTTPTSETHYIGKIYQHTTMNGITKDVSYIYAGSKLVAQQENVSGIVSMKYVHTDHLGSINVITDTNGVVIERLRFDVFGAPVDPNTGAARAIFGATNTDRGYTGHEMDASTGLINMNARLYDPVLGRFINADTIVPSPGNMQGFNRYSYVLNNPLAYTDPTGHSWWTNFRDSVLKPAVTIAVAVAIVYFTGDVGSAWAVAAGATEGGVVAGVAGGVVAGAAAGFAAGATGAALYGGGLGDMWSAGLKGAGAGAIMGGVGGYYGNAWSLGRVGVTSIAGGFAAKSAGGSFNNGFKLSLAISMIAYGADAMRTAMVKQSKLNPDNIGAKSVGFKGDRYKIGGTRALEGQDAFTGTPGTLGGYQGQQGMFFGKPYGPGSWQDYLVEAYGGPHDYLNSFMYNANGNLATTWQTGFLGAAGDVISYANVIPATPFALASVVPQSTLAYLYGDL